MVLIKEDRKLPLALQEAFDSCKFYKDFYVLRGGKKTADYRIFVCFQGDL